MSDQIATLSTGELACSYAAVLLHDDGIPITMIGTLVKAANSKIDSYWAPLFAKLLEKRSVNDLILSVGFDLNSILIGGYQIVWGCIGTRPYDT
ncbi:60S acidic ribosomal protein P1-like [Phoenix dactylifera]|uniref:60S acidic ribosomal protein P1-like n=1 Tax=Phoenix dactylifera TaxID=42345 RepID=A0A8B8ZLL5_PHODC|nr:60S acidic ribosomal protein P1-like [Phoenix dactylifera]